MLVKQLRQVAPALRVQLPASDIEREHSGLLPAPANEPADVVLDLRAEARVLQVTMEALADRADDVKQAFLGPYERLGPVP